MYPFMIILPEPLIQVCLQLLDGVIDFLAKRHMVELFLNGAVKPFADTILLGVPGFSHGVADIFDRQVQLILMMFE